MPLEILGPMVVIGILGIAALLHFGGHSRVDPLTQERIFKEWEAQYPAAPAQRVKIANDGRAALVETSTGSGLIWTMGADTAARIFDSPPEVTGSGDGLTVRTGDFTAPVVHVTLERAEDRELWQQVLCQHAGKEVKT